MTRATVEDTTAVLGQTIRTLRPLISGLSFHGVLGLCMNPVARRNSSPDYLRHCGRCRPGILLWGPAQLPVTRTRERDAAKIGLKSDQHTSTHNDERLDVAKNFRLAQDVRILVSSLKPTDYNPLDNPPCAGGQHSTRTRQHNKWRKAHVRSNRHAKHRHHKKKTGRRFGIGRVCPGWANVFSKITARCESSHPRL